MGSDSSTLKVEVEGEVEGEGEGMGSGERGGGGREALARVPREELLDRTLLRLHQQRRKVVRTAVTRAAAAVGLQPPELPAAVLGSRAEVHGAASIVGWWRACRAAT